MQPSRREPAVPIALLAGLVMMLVPAATAQDAPAQTVSTTGESSPLGTITMPFEARVDGEATTVEPEVLVNVSEVLANGGRHVLVTFAQGCVAGDPATEADPVCAGNETEPGALTVNLTEIRVPGGAGPVSPTLIENETGRVKVWFDVADLDEESKIRLTPVLEVGATQAGLFRLDGLVLVMDRNFVNVEADRGTPLQLFAHTLIGVSEPSTDEDAAPIGNETDGNGTAPNETDSVTEPSDGAPNETEPTPDDGAPQEAQDGGGIPAPGLALAAAAVAAAALATSRRRRGP